MTDVDPGDDERGGLAQTAQQSSGTELGKTGAIIADEVFKCACGAEVRLSGSCRILRGTNISCSQCGLPFVVYGPMLLDVSRQRDDAVRALRHFRSPIALLNALFGGRWTSVGEVLDRIQEERKRPYSLQIHRDPLG